MNKEKQKGITLIALIITIIVMLILVAVTVNAAIGSGLFRHAKDSVEQFDEAQKKESNIGNDTFVEDTVNKHAIGGIVLNTTTETINVGNSKALEATINSSDGTDKEIVWSSSNPEIATVDANGEVTAIATGTATITATINDGSNKSATCVITVP